MASILVFSSTDLEALSQEVRHVLERGGRVAIPTETFYGLGVNPFDETALQRLSAIKGRPDGKPILVLVSSPRDLALFAEHVPSSAAVLMDLFWPGALTLLFPARSSLPAALTAGTGRVGVRLSSCRPLRVLLERVGPLTGTSANRAGAPPAQTARAVAEAFGADVDVIIDAGSTPGGLPSTIVEADETVRIVREGVISRTAIEEALQARGFSLKHA
ncbi:MAG TPA: L-threonylcarbamoyladenylate synthase [Nitrospira sp.]|nr:L-threonylcarbamoyladenylate synthase [Nitrospira sp.]